MQKEITLKDASIPGSRWHLLLILIVGLYLLKSLGFNQLGVGIPAAMGCFALALVWLCSLWHPERIKARFFLGLWWAGLLLLMSAKLVGLFWPEVSSEA